MKYKENQNKNTVLARRIRPSYNELYSDNESSYIFGKPGILKREMMDLVIKNTSIGKRILVIGCGDGPEVHYIASKGHSVTGTDISEEAIRKEKEIRVKAGLSSADINTMNCDFEDFITDVKFGGAVAFFVFHGNREINDMLLKMAHLTGNGGLNAHLYWTALGEKSIQYTLENGKADPIHGVYSSIGWETVAYTEKDIQTTAIFGENAKFKFLIARKPVINGLIRK